MNGFVFNEYHNACIFLLTTELYLLMVRLFYYCGGTTSNKKTKSHSGWGDLGPKVKKTNPNSTVSKKVTKLNFNREQKKTKLNLNNK